MEKNEYEMLVEYSEMAAFNFNSKEYMEVREDLDNLKKAATRLETFFKGMFFSRRVKA